MDDINMFAKNEKELKTMIETKRIYSQYTGMEFGLEKCAMLIRKSAKRETKEGIELPNQIGMRTHREKENYKYFRNIKSGHHQTSRMKKKEYLRTTRNFSKPNSAAEIPSKR